MCMSDALACAACVRCSCKMSLRFALASHVTGYQVPRLRGGERLPQCDAYNSSYVRSK